MLYEDSFDTDHPGAPKPQGLPDKFWDNASGSVRTDKLLKAYLDLEKRTRGMVKVPAHDSTDAELDQFRRGIGVPQRPQDYCIKCQHPAIASDPEVNRRLHQAGFTQPQAQLVYDLTHERVLPAVQRMAEDIKQHHSLQHLKDHFGGDARFTEIARQLKSWGKVNLDPQLYQVMAKTPDGVKAMHRLMMTGEPSMGRMPNPKDEALSEDQLKKMMQDPRYWKKKDPAFIEKVSSGFRQLYGEG